MQKPIMFALVCLAACEQPSDLFTGREGHVFTKSSVDAAVSASAEQKRFYLYDKFNDALVGVVWTREGHFSWNESTPKRYERLQHRGMQCIGEEKRGLDLKNVRWEHHKTLVMLCASNTDAKGLALSWGGTPYKPALHKGELLGVIAQVDVHTGEIRAEKYAAVRFYKNATD